MYTRGVSIPKQEESRTGKCVCVCEIIVNDEYEIFFSSGGLEMFWDSKYDSTTLKLY